MSKVLWIFESTKQAKDHLLSKNIDLYEWDRIIILWSEQTTHEWTGLARKNINGIFLVGKQWEPWQDGKNGKNGIDGKDWREWPRWFTGEKWETGLRGPEWKAYLPDIKEVVDLLYKKLLSNEEFISLCKGKDGKNGKDGKDWKDGKDGIWLDWKDWLDGIDGADGCSIHLVVSFDGIERNFGEKDIVIDYEKNIYFYRNNTVVRI